MNNKLREIKILPVTENALHHDTFIISLDEASNVGVDEVITVTIDDVNIN